ncbi:MAG: mechanosensitive ion channel family protein [Tissierellia bacterium]|nr:mechanosensitive ion channel family protein [Tissierellia bacterium]MDD4781468.1 mechanosensitive ion channel family protein [Tissierellia bacterium]
MIDRFFVERLIYSFLIFFIFLIFKNFFTKIFIKLIKKLAYKYDFRIVSLMVDSLEKPLKNFFIYTGIYCATYMLPFSTDISTFIYKIFRTCVIITITQCLLNIVTAYEIVLNSNVINNRNKPVLKTLFPIIYKFTKVLIIILAVVIIAAEFDLKQLNSILAGIGIGGAAIALASQDLIKNFFGGFVVLADKSFNVGDFINVDSNEGTVEELGIRSTKIRTLNQEIVFVPNSKFTDSPVINYSKREARRVSFIVGVTYDTSSESIKNIIQKIKSVIDLNPMVKENSSLVKFDNFGQNSLEILIQYVIKTADYNIYMDVKDKLNFNVMELFEEEGISFTLQRVSVYMNENK